MLTIKNYNKLFRKDIGVKWRVARIEEINSAYLITLMTRKGSKLQVNLERNPIGEQYELWCWNDILKTGTISPTATPVRIMVKLNALRDMDNLLNSIGILANRI